MRLNGRYHLSEGVVYLEKIKAMPHKELKDITSDIFTAGRSKRIYTDKKFGIPYLSNSDVVNLTLSNLVIITLLNMLTIRNPY